MDRRAFAYIRPYWRRLTTVLLISLVSTAVSLYLPYLTKSLVDDALALFDEYKITSLFVVDENGAKKPVGLLHIHDCPAAR